MTTLAFFSQGSSTIECLFDFDCLPGPWGWVVGLLAFAYTAYCLQVIANKTGTPNAWFAWVPILNLVLTLQIAKKPVWWIVLGFIPLVNIAVGIMVAIALCQARAKPAWLAFALCLPLINLVAIGYIAFSDRRVAHSESPFPSEM